MAYLPNEVFDGTISLLNPRGVINDSLPELLKGEVVTGFQAEATTKSSLKFHYEGLLSKWPTFESDAVELLSHLEDAFDRCGSVRTYIASTIETANPDFTTVEQTQTGAEIDLDGIFKARVAGPVRAVVRTLWNPTFAGGSDPTDVSHLPKSFNYGSAKICPADKRPSGGYEPDLVFKIPGEGDQQRVRLIGELKSCITCDIETLVADRHNANTRNKRKLFGQIARDMRAFGVRFGFISTYEGTIFLQIAQSKSRPGREVLYYSNVIKDTDRFCADTHGTSTLSTRSALLSVIARVADPIEDNWAFDGSQIPERDWISEHAPTAPTEEGTPLKDKKAKLFNLLGNLRPSTRMNAQKIVTPVKTAFKKMGLQPDGPVVRWADTGTAIPQASTPTNSATNPFNGQPRRIGRFPAALSNGKPQQGTNSHDASDTEVDGSSSILTERNGSEWLDDRNSSDLSGDDTYISK